MGRTPELFRPAINLRIHRSISDLSGGFYAEEAAKFFQKSLVKNFTTRQFRGSLPPGVAKSPVTFDSLPEAELALSVGRHGGSAWGRDVPTTFS
jgi:hypothetical protein